jgi:hypothetical protein
MCFKLVIQQLYWKCGYTPTNLRRLTTVDLNTITILIKQYNYIYIHTYKRCYRGFLILGESVSTVVHYTAIVIWYTKISNSCFTVFSEVMLLSY